MTRFGRLAVAAVGFLLASQAACATSKWQDWTGTKSPSIVTEHTTVETDITTTVTACTASEGCDGASDSSVATASGTGASSSASPSSVPPSSTSSPSTPSSSSPSSSASSSSVISTIPSSPPTDTTASGGSSQSGQSTDNGSNQGTSSPGSGVESTSAAVSSSDISQSGQSSSSEITSSGESSATTPSQSAQGTTDVGSSESTGTTGEATSAQSPESPATGGASTGSSGSPSTAKSSNGESTTATGGEPSSSSTSLSSAISSSSSAGPSSQDSTSSSSAVATSSEDESASPSASGSASSTSPSSTGTTDNASSHSASSGPLTTETLTITSVDSDTTLVTVIITTHVVISQSSVAGSSGTGSGDSSTGSTGNEQPSGSSGGVQPPTPGVTPTPTIPSQLPTCDYGVTPWCTPAPILPSSYGCLCPSCWAPSDLCEVNKPTDTVSCPDLGWLCSLTTDISTVSHSLPPGYEMITAAPTTSTLPWWDYISSLHATDDGKHTSDAHFNATLKTSTKTDSEHHTTLYPYRAWECVAGPVCYPPNFNFGCLFPNPLSCANGIGQFFGIWPRPKIPFPPPVGPPDLDYQLESTVVGGDNGGDPTDTASDPETKTSSSSECSSSITYSTCSTKCSTVTVSSSASEFCTSTCTTTSGCSGSDSDATSTAACSYSPYWNDPVISSSVSSLLAQFPFTFPETIDLSPTISSSSTSSFDAKTLPSGGCSSGIISVSGTTVSGAVCTDQLGVPFTSVSGSLLTRSSSIGKTSSSAAKSSTPTTAECSPTPVSVRGSTVTGAVCTSLGVTWTSVPPGSAPSSSSSSSKSPTPGPAPTKPAWASDAKACAHYLGEYDYSPLSEVARHDKTYCVANEAPKGKEGLFKWDPVDNGLIEQVCKGLVSVKVKLTDESAACYLKSPKDIAEGGRWGVLLRVSKSINGCKGKGTPSNCDDKYCGKDIAFADYGVDDCVKNFRKLGKCQGKTWDNDSGEYDTAGGTYYNDCIAWSIVAPLD